MALGESLPSTPSWAVASVTALLIVFSLLMEHSLHLISMFVNRRKRKSLNQALDQLKSGLRSMGFITLLLTVANKPMSKICISESNYQSFLPCVDETPTGFADSDADEACGEGEVPLLSPSGTYQLQMLIMLLAVFHLICSLLTIVMGEFKIKRWEQWEKETDTLDYKLAFDDRRFKLTSQTKFGRRHLKFWSNYDALLWIVCLLRQFTGSVSKADYFALRRGFINAHVGTDSKFNFQKFLRRTLDKDFKLLVTISLPLWTLFIVFLLFGARGFYTHYWFPCIPLIVLLAIGAKLEVIITEMCLKGSRKRKIISGEVSVDPSNELFWFGKPEWLLYAMQFIFIENSFQLAFIFWDLYTFGYQSCLQRNAVENAINIGMCAVAQFVCAHATLPLYALVSQMGSSMKETIFTDQVVAGLRHWHSMAKRNLSATKPKLNKTPSPAAKPQSSSRALWPLPCPRLFASQRSPRPLPSSRVSTAPRSPRPLPSPRPSTAPRSSRPPANSRALISPLSPPSLPNRRSSASNSPHNSPALQSPRGENSSDLFGSAAFEFPNLMRELVEVQKITEEIAGTGGSGAGGDASFRMWWAQEIFSPIGGRGPSDR